VSFRALDVPAIRDELAEFLLGYGATIYEKAIRAGKQNLVPRASSPTRSAAILAADEIRRLAGAELFFVSAEMAELSVAAAKTLPAFSLMPEDLPSPSGFIVFDKPFAVAHVDAWHLPTREDQAPKSGDVQVIAASWSHWTGGNPDWDLGGIWITFFDDRDSTIESGIAEGIHGVAAGDVMRRVLPRVNLNNEVQAPFTRDPVDVSVGGREPVPQSALPAGIHRWTAVLKSTWLLMQQPITSVSPAATTRAARRRYAREDKPLPLVRVITLRRPANPSGSGQSDREYHHQWIVRGHWRQQWYPSREVHRPVWIAPHVKGPEGAPILGGEKVYAWTR
jgi:hypothetical protein